MAKILKIESDSNGIRYIVRFHLESEKIAKYCEASYLGAVREYYRAADLYVKRNVLFLDTPDKEVTKAIAILLQRAIEDMQIVN